MATNIEATTVGTVRYRSQRPEQFQGLFDVILVKVPITEASVAAQVASQGTITVPGVAAGDFVLVAPNVALGGLLIQAVATATNTIQLTVFNVEGTDAVTTLSTAPVVSLLVLKPKGQWSAV